MRRLLIALCVVPLTGSAAPRHDICQDVGDAFTFGVSSYGSLRDWAPEASKTPTSSAHPASTARSLPPHQRGSA